MTEIFIHIGLHKTATTTLQQQFFPACKDLNYLSNSNFEVNEFIESIVITDPIYFDKETARNLVTPYLNATRPNLISREALSGSLYDGVIKHGLDHRSSIIQNLQAAVPEARIILVIRRQDSLSRSIYRQYLKSGGTESSKTFYNLIKNSFSLCTLDKFKYSPYVDLLTKSFPKGVLVLTLEEFIADQDRFLHKLSDFIGVDVPSVKLKKSNQSSLGEIGMEFTRFLNHFFYSRLNPGGLLKGIPKGFRNGKINWSFPSGFLHDRWPLRRAHNKNYNYYKIGNEILEAVKEDNRVLDQRYNLDLGKYEYY